MPKKQKGQAAGLPFKNVEIQPGDIVIGLDTQGRIIYWSREAERVLGYRFAEVEALPLKGIFPQAGLDVKEVLSGRDFAAGFEALRKDKTRVELYLYATAGKEGDGKVTGIVCIGRDVTPFWQPTEGAVEAEKRYQLLLRLSTDGVVVLSTRGKILEINQAGAEIAGVGLEEVIGQSVENFIHPERFKEAEVFWTRLLRKGEKEGTILIKSKTGQEKTVAVRAELLETQRGKRVIAVCRDLTAQRELERARETAEQRFWQLFDWMPAAQFIEKLDGTIVAANERAGKLFGVGREQLIGRKLRVVVPRDIAAVLPQIRAVLLEKHYHEAEVVTQLPDGRRLWFVIGSLLLESKDEPLILTFIYDITAMRQTVFEARKRETAVNLFLSQLPAIVWTTDKEFNIISAAGSGLISIGVKPADVEGKGIQTLFGDKKEIKDAHQRALSGASAGFEFSRQARVFQARVEPMRGVEGELLGVIGVAQDVTEQREMARALSQTLMQYQALFEAAPMGIGVIQDGKVVMINREGARLLGYESSKEVIGISVVDALHPDDVPEAVSRLRKVLALGLPNPPMEERLKKRDGSYITLEMRSAPFVYDNRPAILVIARDLSETKKLTEQVEEQFSHTRAILESSPYAIALATEGRVVYANHRFAEILGYELRELLGKPFIELLPSFEQERLKGYEEARSAGKPAPSRYQVTVLTKEGKEKRVDAYVATYKVGERVFILGFINPVQEG